ncbi:UNVERIFIED_CONTAM: Transposon Tf2-12 polyprotein [Sesamum latifolium]|uniref:Transposon Tf2-12 polyprotein n=1 Tax=Sesamum latifolium TaxID=2727402 RepID=A0AAW2TL75_9LAMI
MPFGLKNAGVTYQRLVNLMFKELIEKTMKVYVDDMLVKSMEQAQHLKHLEESFAVIRKYGMKLNPNKCTLGVIDGKFLGYMVIERGIEANPEKIEAILQMPTSKSVKDIKKLAGRMTSLNRFILKAVDKSLPFFKILRNVKNLSGPLSAIKLLTI